LFSDETFCIQPSDVEAEAEAEAPEAVVFWWKQKQKRKRLKICRFHFVSKLLFEFGRFLLTRSYFFQILFDIYLNYVQIIFFFENNDFKYYITNCITTCQKQKQNWKPIWKRKRYRKRLIYVGSRSGSGSA
jgi:hypothetical protein